MTSYEYLVELKGVKKQYQHYFTVGGTLLDLFNPQRVRKKGIWALKGISLTLKKGESLGIIGPNGAGKSTILKIISRITLPTSGEVNVHGKTAYLIEVGAGLHPDLTGIENIFLYGIILGMKRKEIREKLDKIMEFSGLQDYIDLPVKKYSSGMKVRLGFSVAIHTEPDILLVDEVLAVGDAAFKKKCYKKIEELKKSGIGIILVSHNMKQILEHTDRTIFLNKGKIVFEGKPEEAVKRYNEFLEKRKEEKI